MRNVKTSSLVSCVVVALLAVAAAAVMLVGLTTASYADVNHGELTWKTTKSHGKYVTKFYASGELTAKVVTKKKLPVKVVKSKNVTRKKLTQRKNKYILVEIVKGTCLNKYGDGKCSLGYYISYRCVKHYQTGDKYRTYLIYANSKYVDDITGRCDYLIGYRNDTADEIVCPNCDGTSRDCVYWFIDTDGVGKHMTAQQIAEFEKMEARE